MLTYDPDRGITIRDFLESAAGAASLGNLDGGDLMRIMPMRLLGAGKAFYRTYMESNGLDPRDPDLGRHWEDFRVALRDRFRKTTDLVSTLMQLANCQQEDK